MTIAVADRPFAGFTRPVLRFAPRLRLLRRRRRRRAIVREVEDLDPRLFEDIGLSRPDNRLPPLRYQLLALTDLLR